MKKSTKFLLAILVIQIFLLMAWLWAGGLRENKKSSEKLMELTAANKTLTEKNEALEEKVQGHIESEAKRKNEIEADKKKITPLTDEISRLKSELEKLQNAPETTENGFPTYESLLQQNKLYVNLTNVQKLKIKGLEDIIVKLELNYKSCQESRKKLMEMSLNYEKIIVNDKEILSIQKKKQFKRGALLGAGGAAAILALIFLLIK